MIAAWMLLSVLLGAVVALGALALDGACRAMRTPTRWTWVGALAALVLFTALVPLRRTPIAGPFHITSSVTTVMTGPDHVVATVPLMQRALIAARSMMTAPVARLAQAVARAVGPAADRWLLAGWIACSLVLLVLALAVFGRLMRAQRMWPVIAMHGERVHVSPYAGPAVLGFLRGAIVVPHWLATCTADVQQVVVAHEREHVRARDPLLLTLGALSVVLLPWNPAVWWILARLRLAVELDCDRRVLSAGVRTRDYGALLIDLAGRTAGMPLGAPLVGLTMLAERTTHLERRIVAMSASRPRHPALRIAAGSLVALAATLAACEAKMPTSVDVDNMTAASAERAATTTGILSANDTLRAYFIDGRRVTAAEARAVAPGQIASIAVMHDSIDHSKGTVRIVTRDARDAAATLASAGVPGDTHHVTIQFERKLPPGGAVRRDVVPDTFVEFGVSRNPRVVRALASGGAARVTLVAPDTSSFAGLVFIDGKRVDQSAMKQLNPTAIQSIEVIKGPRATELYPNDPAAAQGVIQITTKHGTK